MRISADLHRLVELAIETGKFPEEEKQDIEEAKKEWYEYGYEWGSGIDVGLAEDDLWEKIKKDRMDLENVDDNYIDEFVSEVISGSRDNFGQSDTFAYSVYTNERAFYNELDLDEIKDEKLRDEFIYLFDELFEEFENGYTEGAQANLIDDLIERVEKVKEEESEEEPEEE
jgi:hypothetical protein